MRNEYDSKRHQEGFDVRVAVLAGRQYGAFSREQAIGLGATRPLVQRRVRSGRWIQPYRGAYLIAGTAQTWRQTLLIASFAWGNDACVSHRSAASLWAIAGPWEQPELTIPSGRKRAHRDHIIHRNALDAKDTTSLGPILVTTPSRTLRDLAAVLSRDELEEALDEAIRRRLTSVSRLRWELRRIPGSGTRGIGVLRDLVQARDRSNDVSQSVLETKVLQVLRKAGLPKPELQHQVRKDGALVAIVDFAYPGHKVAVEADGYHWHSGRARWQRDLTRRNALTGLGWTVVHVTWSDIENHRTEWIEVIRRAIG